jgi:hypothetical protein
MPRLAVDEMYYIARHVLVDIEVVVIFVRRISAYSVPYNLIQCTVVVQTCEPARRSMSGYSVGTRPVSIKPLSHSPPQSLCKLRMYMIITYKLELL